MSIKRSHATTRSSAAGGTYASKIDRQSLFDELRRLAGTGDGFSSVDVALTIGTDESVVAKALLGLASAGLLERAEAGRYRATPMGQASQAEFVKALAQTSHADPSRQRDLTEIGRLKQNNDIMRQRLLAAMAERDHYLAVLRAHGIEPGAPPPSASTTSASPSGAGPTNAPAPEAAGSESANS